MNQRIHDRFHDVNVNIGSTTVLPVQASPASLVKDKIQKDMSRGYTSYLTITIQSRVRDTTV